MLTVGVSNVASYGADLQILAPDASAGLTKSFGLADCTASRRRQEPHDATRIKTASARIEYPRNSPADRAERHRSAANIADSQRGGG